MADDTDPDQTQAMRDSDPYVDTANRLQEQIQTQVSILNGIDNKSEHVTRLVGILVGLVFSVLSLVANYDPIKFDSVGFPVEVAFVLGLVCLLLAMAGAIVTYLSSRFRIGLDSTVGYYVSNPESNVQFDRHIRRVCGSYAEAIEQRVIETNSKRFRRTLYLLLVGVVFLTTAGVAHLGGLSTRRAWVGVGISALVSGVVGWYILTERYLTLEQVGK